ncbi:hypothetical protein [Serratia marcescens]|uniref:hypothetical protein n=1 Tax=Serratia marcescens TaxID=615 RepID=UPI0021BA47E4|nr:hypothetical protein [Serratia marcescens]
MSKLTGTGGIAMYDYNYQRMVEETLEQYDRTLAADPDEQALLDGRIESMRKSLRIPVERSSFCCEEKKDRLSKFVEISCIFVGG